MRNSDFLKCYEKRWIHFFWHSSREGRVFNERQNILVLWLPYTRTKKIYIPPLPIPTEIYDTRMQKIAQRFKTTKLCVCLHRIANENWPGAAPTQLVKANRVVFSLRNFTNYQDVQNHSKSRHMCNNECTSLDTYPFPFFEIKSISFHNAITSK